MTKQKKKYVPVPRIAFKLDDEILNTPVHKMRPVDKHIIIVTESTDTGNIIARVGRLLKRGFNVYVKTEDNLWLNHFDFVGEGRYEFKCFTRKPVSGDSDVQ